VKDNRRHSKLLHNVLRLLLVLAVLLQQPPFDLPDMEGQIGLGKLNSGAGMGDSQ
jgi:hypothetical protein